jgi:hypothetical protein
MQNQVRCRSSALRRLYAAAARAGVRPEERDCLLAAVLTGLAVRMPEAQWRRVCGSLPWDVRSLAGTPQVRLIAPSDDLNGAVAATTGLPRPVAVVAVRTVLMELARMLPPAALPPRLTVGVPGL